MPPSHSKPTRLDLADWLMTDAVAGLLQEYADAEPTPAIVSRLRKSFPAEQSAALLEQVDLRRRAKTKFRHPERMFFTRKGLEQATDEWIAEYKAKRYPDFANALVDLCCGVGGDLLGMRLARARSAGVELDPSSARFAQQNTGLRVSTGDAADVDLEDYGAWHCDPDRRANGSRSTRPEMHTPSADELTSWMQRNPNAGIKLAPATALSDSWVENREMEWISSRGECRQLVLWSGALAKTAGQRRATRVLAGDNQASTFVGDPSVVAPRVESIGRYVYEPDPAILAAELGGDCARQRGLCAFTEAAYFTADSLVVDPMLAGFEGRRGDGARSEAARELALAAEHREVGDQGSRRPDRPGALAQRAASPRRRRGDASPRPRTRRRSRKAGRDHREPTWRKRLLSHPDSMIGSESVMLSRCNSPSA